jgi:hypothetical protein
MKTLTPFLSCLSEAEDEHFNSELMEVEEEHRMDSMMSDDP